MWSLTSWLKEKDTAVLDIHEPLLEPDGTGNLHSCRLSWCAMQIACWIPTSARRIAHRPAGAHHSDVRILRLSFSPFSPILVYQQRQMQTRLMEA